VVLALFALWRTLMPRHGAAAAVSHSADAATARPVEAEAEGRS
jgi:hypothetical protein